MTLRVGNYLSIIIVKRLLTPNKYMSKYFDRTSLKRNKRSYESTALNTIQQNRTILKSHYRMSATNRLDDVKTKHHHFRVDSNQEQEAKEVIEIKCKISQIAINIIEEERKFVRENESKFMRHFYYRGISRINKHPILKVPEIMNKIYQEQHIKRQGPFSPPVSVQHGYLKQINCIYYAVQNKIIFIKAEDLINHNQITDQTIPHVVYEVRSQVISIFQLPKNNLIFQGYENIIVVVYLWEMEFYAWEGDAIVKEKCMAVGNLPGQYSMGKLKSLNYIYKFPVEKVKSLGCASDGRVFYFDDKGVLYQITPEQQTKFLICKTGRYTIKNYLNTSPNTFQLLSKSTGRLAPIINLASNIYQLSKYLLSSHIEAQIVFCDKKRELLFALLRKQIKLLFGQQVQIFIVCYCIKQKSKSRLIHKISEEWLIDKYLQHSPSDQPNKNYQIHSISPAPSWHQSANLTITTKSGIKILTQISPNQSRIVEIIRPPDYQIFQPTTPLHLNLSTVNAYSNQYAPEQTNQYILNSTCDDEERMIYTLSKGAHNYSYLVDRTYFGGGIDVNFRGNAVEMEIYKQGSWKVSVHKLYNRIDEQWNGQDNNKSKYELSSQLIVSPKHYIFLNQSKLQLITYLRPVDILYTAITCLIKNRPNQRNNNPAQQLMSKQKILRYLFVNKANQFCLVNNVGISEIELCAMLLQIVVEGDAGGFQYSMRAAQEIEQIWKQVSIDTRNKYPNDTTPKWNEPNPQHNPHPTRNKAQTKAHQIQQQSKQQLQSISSSTSNPILHKLNTIIMYTSKLVHPIWNTPLSLISTKIRDIMLDKVQLLEKYLRDSQSSLRIYCEQGKTNTNKQVEQVWRIVSNIRQLLLLITHVPITTNTSVKFCDSLLGSPELEQCIFEAIRKQYKYYVINLWKNLFPNFINNQLMKLIMLYGQLQEISTIQQLIGQLENQRYVSKLPQYFIRYLGQNRKIDIPCINTIIKNNPYMKNQQYIPTSTTNTSIHNKQQSRQLKNMQVDRADYEFMIPSSVKDIVERYGKVSGEVSQADIQTIIGVVMDRQCTKQLTITNKQSLFTYIFTHLPTNPKLNYLAKCISVQYELYRYYISSIQSVSTQSDKNKILTRILPISIRKQSQPVVKFNQQTMELLRYRTIVDTEQLRKLVWATADYWLMADFLVTFGEVEELRAIFKRVCEEYQRNNSRKYSSFAGYIQKYVLNFAIKSQFSEQILQVICQVIDMYLQSQPNIQKTIKQWIAFSLPTITQKLIWLPQLLIKIGYKPQIILNVYFQQLEAIFNKNVGLQNQILYGIKFLNSYTLADNYVQNKVPQFRRIVENQLGFLQTENNVTQKVQIGLKKLLDMLNHTNI